MRRQKAAKRCQEFGVVFRLLFIFPMLIHRAHLDDFTHLTFQLQFYEMVQLIPQVIANAQMTTTNFFCFAAIVKAWNASKNLLLLLILLKIGYPSLLQSLLTDTPEKEETASEV